LLLSGAVIGSVNDLATVYYNPARLAKIENPAFLLSGKLYQLDRIDIEDGAGDGLDLRQTRFAGSPNMAAGTFKIKALPNHFFSYSFLTRNHLNVNYFIQNNDFGDIIVDWPGEEYYGGQFRFQKELKEDWLGFTWAYKINESWSVGITNFVTLRHQNEFLSTEIQAYSPGDEIAVFNQSRNIDLTNIGLLWKIAFSYELRNLALGLTITSPKISLRGSGSVFYQDIYNGPAGSEINGRNKAYVSNYQENLNSKHRSPLSVGFGLGFTMGKSTIHFSSEWFAAVEEYQMLSSETFEGQSSKEIYEIKMIDMLNGVINTGFGYQYNLNERYTLYGSFTTDFSAVASATPRYLKDPEMAYGSMVQADIYHVGGGILIAKKWLEITAGLSHAFASQNIKRPFEFPENEFETLSTEEVRMKFSRWKFVLGFSLPFYKRKEML
jgi:long-subunit fatty acid transport protein